MGKRFANVYITEPGKQFDSAAEVAERIKFISNGYDKGDGLDEDVQTAVDAFDPATDAWVPVGRILTVAKVGLGLARRFGPDTPITIGVYKDGEYTWVQM